MGKNGRSRIPDILKNHHAEILDDWIADLAKASVRNLAGQGAGEQRQQCSEFIRLLVEATRSGDWEGAENDPAWQPLRELVLELSRQRGLQGYSPRETAVFFFSFKQPLFAQLRKQIQESNALAEELWRATAVIDGLGLWSTDAHQKAREEMIQRQQQELLELSTPVVTLWEGILALPLIGTLDSSRTQTVMESLLQKIVETGSEIAIIDITGVPTVDTLTAQHLLKTVTATRLMGADCIISGIRPQIAQTIVHLGLDLGVVTTKATLAGALALAMQRTGLSVHRSQPAAGAAAKK